MLKQRRGKVNKMATVSNHLIPSEWAMSREAQSHTGNYWTNGDKLYSYNLCIGETMPNGDKLLHDFTAGGIEYYSQTTSCHVGKARQYADLIRDKYQIVRVR